MFNNNHYYPMPQGPAYQHPAFQQTMPVYQPPAQQPVMMQDGMVSARFVSGREEAVASNVMPGSMFLFYDRANRMIYAKLIDPQTGMPEFREFAEMQPVQQNAPQYVTPDVLQAFGQELEQRFERRIEALQSPKQSSRKAVTADD